MQSSTFTEYTGENKMDMKSLIDMLDIMQLGTAYSNYKPITSHIGFDGENAYVHDGGDLHIVCEGVSTSAGGVTTDLKTLMKILKANKKRTFEGFKADTDSATLEVNYTGGRTALKTFPLDEMGYNPELKGDVIGITQKTMQDVLAKVLPFCASYDHNNVLGGVCFDAQYIAATDGSRLARLDAPLGLDHQVIVKHEQLKIVQKIIKKTKYTGAIKMVVDGDHVAFTVGDYTVIHTKLEGIYPKYNQLIPSESKFNIDFTSADILEGIKSVAPMANERTNVMKLDILHHDLKLMTNTPDVGEANAIVYCISDVGADDLGIVGFNYKYVQDCINACGGDIRMKISHALSPTVFQNKDDDTYLHLIMPVQIK